MIGDYPTQLDEIDQWLNDNFGILPGACSSTENLRYSVARRVAEALWPKTQSIPSDETLEEKAISIWKSRGNGDASQLVQFSFDEVVALMKTGAEWQKEQMLKDAVKGTVCKDKKCVWIELIPNALPDYEDIEPVKCVVMKED